MNNPILDKPHKPPQKYSSFQQMLTDDLNTLSSTIFGSKPHNKQIEVIDLMLEDSLGFLERTTPLLLSIDIGISNFSYAVYCPKTNQVLTWNNSNLGIERPYTSKKLATIIIQHLQRIENQFQLKDLTVLIEKQLSRFSNPIIEGILHTYYCSKGVVTIEIEPKAVKKYFKWGNGYKKKKDSIQMVKRMIESRKWEFTSLQINNFKKFTRKMTWLMLFRILYSINN